MNDPVKMIKLDCGRHWGSPNGGSKCRKCPHINAQRMTRSECCQAGGTPYLALVNGADKTDILNSGKETMR